jgi:hypothetical protein
MVVVQQQEKQVLLEKQTVLLVIQDRHKMEVQKTSSRS